MLILLPPLLTQSNNKKTAILSEITGISLISFQQISHIIVWAVGLDRITLHILLFGTAKPTIAGLNTDAGCVI